MTQTTDSSQTANLTLTASTQKRLGKKAAASAEEASSPAAAPDLVNSVTCERTGTVYTVGDWVSYFIKDEEMTGQVLSLELQAPPFEPVASVPNHTAGRPWTRTLWELTPVQAPETDSPFPVTEAQIDAALAGEAAPELTPVEVVAVPVVGLGESLAPDTLGLHSIPLAQLVRSGCNVRRHYDPAAIEELSASLKAEGQIENATGRWNADGQVEIVAGESRRRAQVLREEAGELGLTLLVNIRELDDAEALAISATENMRRRSMTGLEECEAMMRLNDAGRTVEDLAAMFGYKTLQPVADRILVARNLHTDGRNLLDSGELSLAKAFVIARAAGQDVQKNLVHMAPHRTAASLAQMLTTGQFLVKLAGFNVEKSGLAVKRDMFDTYEAFFKDKAKALDAQLAHAKTLAERRIKKGKYDFVDVEATKGYWSAYDHKKYASGGNGLCITVNMETGELQERDNVRLRREATVKADGSAAPVEREISGPAHLAAHTLRAKALRHCLLGREHTTLALTVHALMVSHGGWNGRAALGATDNWEPGAISETAVAQLQTWQATLSAALGTTPALGNQPGERLHNAAQSLPLYDYLVTLDLPELLSLLNVIVANRVYEPTSDPKADAAPLYNRLAAEVDAPAELAATFTLTDEWLKPYPKHELAALAEDAEILTQPIQDARTLKEARALILEHAERLHEQGYVPALLRFPAPPAVTAAAGAEA